MRNIIRAGLTALRVRNSVKIAAIWRTFPALVLFMVLLLPIAAWSDNVALNKAVTLSDPSSFSGAAAATVVDGLFLPEQTYWQTGVWWNGLTPNIVINLGGLYQINSLTGQADDNDTYRVSYWDFGTSSWQTAWDVPQIYSYGLVTRGPYSLPTPITTDELKFEATGGDNNYAVSEIQAFGSQVPVPPSLLLLGSGLLGMAGWRKFRKN